MGFDDRKAPAGQQQIGKGEQRIGLCGVFRQASITHSSMTKPVLDDMGRMLDFRPDAGLQMLELFPQASQFIVGQRLAFGALHGHMPRHRFADQSDQWPAGAFDLRIERLDQFVQLAPRRHAVDLGQEAVAPR